MPAARQTAPPTRTKPAWCGWLPALACTGLRHTGCGRSQSPAVVPPGMQTDPPRTRAQGLLRVSGGPDSSTPPFTLRLPSFGEAPGVPYQPVLPAAAASPGANGAVCSPAQGLLRLSGGPDSSTPPFTLPLPSFGEAPGVPYQPVLPAAAASPGAEQLARPARATGTRPAGAPLIPATLAPRVSVSKGADTLGMGVLLPGGSTGAAHQQRPRGAMQRELSPHPDTLAVRRTAPDPDGWPSGRDLPGALSRRGGKRICPARPIHGRHGGGAAGRRPRLCSPAESLRPLSPFAPRCPARSPARERRRCWPPSGSAPPR